MAVSRRRFAQSALAGLAAPAFAAKINSTVNGVTLGVQSYSFRDRPLDQAIAAIKEIGLGSVELWSGHVEPMQPRPTREELRNWRLSTPLSHFQQVRKKLDEAGIDLYAYNYSFRDDFTDAEIERGFEMVKAMGVKYITASSNVSTAVRVAPFAGKHAIKVGMHNHSNIKPNEFARPEDFEEASKAGANIVINLDIGHFVAAGFDPVAFLAKHHAQIITLHIKDRKKNQGANVSFGEGDTPIREVLQLLKKNRWKIPANIEYEYRGEDTLTEVRRCLDYCKNALA
ncbi:MAG: sugar phosphate isomerase/epimerase [Acidimicrobiia bacterium]|nr:sugar phosphate isomerase/epimerase [Acidimicrobiia bacterium]